MGTSRLGLRDANSQTNELSTASNLMSSPPNIYTLSAGMSFAREDTSTLQYAHKGKKSAADCCSSAERLGHKARRDASKQS